LLVFVIAACML